MAITFTASSKVLFIGDSITDCGRRTDAEHVGSGYVRLVRDYLAARDPAGAPIVINRGISGNKMPDLQKRWQRDVIDESPDVLSVFVGINDVWHGLPPRGQGCDIDDYVAGYRDILAQTRAALPRCELVLCEPSVLWLSEHPGANRRLRPYVDAVHSIGKEFGAGCVVRLHEAFTRAGSIRPNIAWTTDGVHPTSTGHMLIARTCLAATGWL
jgi:acyl-CoA thioesterase I